MRPLVNPMVNLKKHPEKTEIEENIKGGAMSNVIQTNPQSRKKGPAPLQQGRSLLSLALYTNVRYRKVTICPRVQAASGEKVVVEVPLVTPCTTAHITGLTKKSPFSTPLKPPPPHRALKSLENGSVNGYNRPVVQPSLLC